MILRDTRHQNPCKSQLRIPQKQRLDMTPNKKKTKEKDNDTTFSTPNKKSSLYLDLPRPLTILFLVPKNLVVLGLVFVAGSTVAKKTDYWRKKTKPCLGNDLCVPWFFGATGTYKKPPESTCWKHFRAFSLRHPQ